MVQTLYGDIHDITANIAYSYSEMLSVYVTVTLTKFKHLK